MTITKDVSAKIAVAIVAVSMVFSAFATSAKAQTTEDLQKMINDLLAQVSSLQSQVGQGGQSVASGICPYTWTRDLNVGATGADVMKLQQSLNADADTRVASEGAGSVGMETEFYGPATAAAVSKFQVKYRADILSPANLVNPTGYFGPSSRAKMNSICTSAPVVDTDDDATDEDEEDEDEDEDFELGGEASLDTASLDDAADDTIEEGSEDSEVAELTVEFSDGDAEISRIDISFDSGDTSDAWDALDEVSLWVDGDKVASVDASDEDNYQNDDMTLRFSGLDIVAMEDEELDIVIAATLQNNIDADELDTYTVRVESLRFFDAGGVASTELDPANPDTASFTIEEAGTDDELIVKTSSNDLDATTLQVEDDSKSDWYNVFTFDLDTDDSINDIELTTVVVKVTVSSSTVGAIVDDAEIVIDGVTIDEVTWGTDGATRVATFDVDGDVTIDAGDRIEAELMLRFKSLALGNEGITVMAEVDDVDSFEAEGADDLEPTTPDQLRGAAQGDAHTLRTAGLDISLEKTSAVVTTGDGAGDDYGTYEIEVEVTAFEQDVYIATDGTVSFDFSMIDGTGAVINLGSTSTVLTSTADESGVYYEITEGETETITLQVTFDAASTNQAARLQLNSISFADTATTPNKTQTTLPASDYRTSSVTLVN